MAHSPQVDIELIRACEQASATLGAAVAAKPLLERLLGPSFDYVGEAMADLFARYGNRNVVDILRRAAARLDDQTRKTAFINPRILRMILEDGCFADDDVAKEYYAGLFVSAFTNQLDDDRAITLLAAVRNLTARQIRAHHLLYSLIRKLHGGRQMSFANDAANSSIFMPEYLAERDVLVASSRDVQYVLQGLIHEDLVDRIYTLDRIYFDASSDKIYHGWLLTGTAFGAELFLWVHNAREAVGDDIFRGDTQLKNWDEHAPTPNGATDAATLHQYESAIVSIKHLRSVLNQYDLNRADDVGIGIALDALNSYSRVLPQATQRWLKSYRKMDLRQPATIAFIARRLDQCQISMTGGSPSQWVGA